MSELIELIVLQQGRLVVLVAPDIAYIPEQTIAQTDISVIKASGSEIWISSEPALHYRILGRSDRHRPDLVWIAERVDDE